MDNTGFPDGLNTDQGQGGFPDGLNNTPQTGAQKFLSLVGDTTKDTLTKPIEAFKQYMTDPTAQAKTLPYLGAVGGAGAGLLLGQPIAGGMAGGMAGQTLRDTALTALGNQAAPHTVTEGLGNLAEGALRGATLGSTVGAGDALLGLSKAGQTMGAVEKAAGIVDRVPLIRPTPSNLGTTLDALEGQLNGGTITDPQTAKDSLNLLKDIRDNPKLYGMSKVATAQINRLWPQAQNLVSTLVDQANAEHIVAGALPSRVGLVKDAAKYFKILSPARAGGAVVNTLFGSPVRALGTSGTAASIVSILKALSSH